MLNFSPEKLLIVGVLALIILGPTRLPVAAKSVGRFVSTLRHLSSGFQSEVRQALAEPKDALEAAMGEFRPPDVRRSVREAVSSTLSPATPPADEGPPEQAQPSESEQAQPSESTDTSHVPDAPGNPSLN